MSLAQGIKQVSKTKVRFYPDFDSMSRQLNDILKPGDLLLTLGAGSIWKVGEQWLNETDGDAGK